MHGVKEPTAHKQETQLSQTNHASAAVLNRCTNEWRITLETAWRSLKVTGNGTIQQAIYHLLLMVSSNNSSILQHFYSVCDCV